MLTLLLSACEPGAPADGGPDAAPVLTVEVEEVYRVGRVEGDSWDTFLSLGQVIRMLETMDSTGLEMDGAGIVVAWWNQQWEFGDTPEQCTEFAWVESDHYPGLAPWYAARAAAWRAMRHAEDPDRQPRWPG